MNNQRPAMFVPALIGGAVAGILTGIPFLNCLCCIWIIGGAMLSAYLLAKDSPVVLSAGDGAIVGVLAGIIAAIVNAFVTIPLRAFNREFVRKVIERVADFAEEMPPQWEEWIERGTHETSAPMFFLGIMISAIIFSIFGALGGIIGISLFGKKAVKKQGELDVPKDTGNRQS